MSGLDETYLAWESTVYPDGGMYEGLMKDGQCHGKGVFQYADGDRFEGEYVEGQMNGMGVYRWSNGSIFKGQWKENNMHGCGKKWYPGGALEEGEWLEDNFVGDFGACDANTALQAVHTAEKVAEQARDFMYKPDGDVSYKMGLALDQEPTVYTAGTEYLMPGPAGNLFKVPNDPTIRKVLVDQARKALAVFQSVNWPVPPPEMLAEDMREEEARKAAAPPAPVRAKAALPEDDDEDDEDEVSSPPAAAPRRPGGMASLSLSTSRHADTLARAFAQLGRSLRRPRLERAQC